MGLFMAVKTAGGWNLCPRMGFDGCCTQLVITSLGSARQFLSKACKFKMEPKMHSSLPYGHCIHKYSVNITQMYQGCFYTLNRMTHCTSTRLPSLSRPCPKFKKNIFPACTDVKMSSIRHFSSVFNSSLNTKKYFLSAFGSGKICSRKFSTISFCLAKMTSSSLFVSDSKSQNTAPVDIDLDLDRKIASRDELEKNLRIRGMKFDVNSLCEDHKEMKQIQNEKSALESERKQIARMMSELAKMKDDDDVARSRAVLIKRGKEVREALKQIVRKWWKYEEKVILSGLCLPNDLDPGTPERKTVVLDTFGEIPASASMNHVDIGKKFGLIKFSSFGQKAYYLKGEMAMLEQKLISFMSKKLSEQGFSQMACPEVFRTLAVEGCGIDFNDSKKTYTIHDGESLKNQIGEAILEDHLHIHGASLQSFASYLARTMVNSASLPVRMFAIGRSYEPESDFPGLFGAHQLVKAVMFSACGSRESSSQEFESCQKFLWKISKSFGLPVRLVLVPGSELTPAESLRSEIQMWIPSLQSFIKIASVSQYMDYVSRRLMSFHGDIKDCQYIHMVHGDALDVTRLVASIMECSIVDEGKLVLHKIDLEEEFRT